jgi:hypothetical protein
MTTYIPHNCCLLVFDDLLIVEIIKCMINKNNPELQLEKVHHIRKILKLLDKNTTWQRGLLSS